MRDNFELGGWRNGVHERRELAIKLVKNAASTGFIEPELRILKTTIVYDNLSAKDKNSFRVFCHGVRKIHQNWHVFDVDQRDAFLSGKLPYSAAIALLNAY
ncbi:MAG: hypothetical protein ABL928_01145 [Sphingorhabdus sp.]